MERSEFKISEEIKPGKDFYQYSNKYWIDNNPLPKDKSRYATFDKLHEENLERLMELIDKPCANLPIPLQMKIINLRDKYLQRDFYENANYFNENILAKITKKENLQELQKLHTSWMSKGIGYLFDISIDADLKDCDNNIIYISQNGLSLNRDYYEDEEIMSKFKEYITKVVGEFTYGNQDILIDTALEFEKRLASFSSTETQMRDVEMSYNIYTFDQLVSDFPEVPW